MSPALRSPCHTSRRMAWRRGEATALRSALTDHNLVVTKIMSSPKKLVRVWPAGAVPQRGQGAASRSTGRVVLLSEPAVGAGAAAEVAGVAARHRAEERSRRDAAADRAAAAAGRRA